MEMANRGAIRGEIWDFGGGGVVLICIWSIIDLLVFNVILGSFRALASKWPVTRKQLTAVERNGGQFLRHWG